MKKAIWNKVVVAESDKTIVVEGNHYFPKSDVKWEYFKKSSHTSVCGWKGNCNYFDVEVDGKTSKNGAWTYLNPKKQAEKIKEFVAFWNGVVVKNY